MAQFTIYAAVEGFANLADSWAEREERIDFRKDLRGALLCTTSFCAAELKRCLSISYPDMTVAYADSAPSRGLSVELVCVSALPGDGSFRFELRGTGSLGIHGSDRNGLVNGTYEFLRLQGWRWLEPGDSGEYHFKTADTPVFPEKDEVFTPSFRYRAFYFENPSGESTDMALWMARNRMNVFGAFPRTTKLAQKFGFYIQAGGHIFQKLLMPDRRLESGKTVFEEHPEWFGTPELPKIRTAANAMNTQFCCTNAELMDFFAEEVIFRLTHDWAQADIVELSGFDCWGSTCHCPECSRLPSDSDKYINFMSEIRKRIERAAGEGLFDHPFILNSWAYEGTATMKPPLLGIPENMKKAHDNCIAFVINRCYQHSLDDPCCKINAEYAEVVREWGRMTSDLALWGGEYYNVSRHEDLPLLFMDNMKRSMRFYHESGAKGITYMHTPITGWSVRAMTQMLHSLLAWNIDADTEVASSEFFHLRYGCHADSMKKVYGYIEEASEPVAEWRAWRHSILCQMYSSFDGDNVDTPLGFRHYASHAEAVADGEKCAVLYQKAWETIADEFEKEKDLASGDFHLIAPENPDQAYASKTYDRIANALAEDLRLVNYGHDVMEIMTLVVAYYDACFRKCEPEKEAIWIRIREQERLMQAYTILVVYNAWKPFHECRDALTRSQMRQAINAIRKQRLMHRRKCVIEKNVPKKMCHDTLEIETKGDVY